MTTMRTKIQYRPHSLDCASASARPTYQKFQDVCETSLSFAVICGERQGSLSEVSQVCDLKRRGEASVLSDAPSYKVTMVDVIGLDR